MAAPGDSVLIECGVYFESNISINSGITVLGSGELVRSLLAAGLVDDVVLLQHPLVLGTGMRLFDATPLTLDLRRSITTTTGVIIGQYAVR